MDTPACPCPDHVRRAAAPDAARAAPADAAYDSLLLSCIDPRMVAPVFHYMRRRGLDGRYSQVSLAGAALGVEAPAFAAWRQTFWENLDASIALHRIARVIAINHQDCGAARIAYGADSVATAEAERRLHQRVLTAFKAEVATRYPGLRVEGLFMALDGEVTAIA